MKISVVIPSYNSAHCLPVAVASVLAQTRAADELIVVDDGSTDNVREVCDSFGPAVKYVRRKNGGLSAARNTGVANASGDWFLFLDADDRLLPHALAVLEKTALSGDAGVVYGFVLQRWKTPYDSRIHSHPYAAGDPPKPAKDNFWWTSISTAGCALISRELNEKVGGFDESFRQVEDSEYWLRCGVTAPFAHCDDIVLDKAYSGGSLGHHVANSIWFRVQLQLKFLMWCEHRGIDTSFLNATRTDIIDNALVRISRERAWEILGPVLDQARRIGVRTPRTIREHLRLSFLEGLGKVSPPPALCREVYRDWHEK